MNSIGISRTNSALTSDPTVVLARPVRPSGPSGRGPTLLALATVVLLGAACSHRGYYVLPDDVEISKAGYWAAPEIPCTVEFEFQTNGDTNLPVTREWRGQVVYRVKQSPMFSLAGPDDPGARASIQMVVDNVFGSLAGAMGQGFMTGITGGLAGSSVIDNYVIEISLEAADATVVREERYEKAIVSTSGNVKDKPSQTEYTTLDEAFKKLLDDAILHFLQELGSSEALAALARGG